MIQFTHQRILQKRNCRVYLQGSVSACCLSFLPSAMCTCCISQERSHNACFFPLKKRLCYVIVSTTQHYHSVLLNLNWIFISLTDYCSSLFIVISQLNSQSAWYSNESLTNSIPCATNLLLTALIITLCYCLQQS